ncbi:MAG: ribulose phosphate epimerase [Myxococcales bacterium]|nr:ribulose phosphate epimerase [Myxococcales bacterium]
MKNLRLLSLVLAGSALTLTACGDKNDDGDADTVASTTTTGTDDVDTTDTSTTADTTTTVDTSTTDTTDNTDFIIPVGDMPQVAPSCDPFAQDCPDGEKCVAYASSGGTWDANKCVPVGGDGQVGDPCVYDGAEASTDNCGADTWCWGADAEGNGTCTLFCTGTADDPICPLGSSCSIANDGSINICLPGCDPVLQDCEAEGENCYWAGDDFVCAPGGDLMTGDACGFINDCGAGNICIDATYLPTCDGSACCAGFCDLGDPMCIIAGTECVAFFDPGTEPPGLEHVGVCILPG